MTDGTANPFSAETTADEVLAGYNLAGKRVLVTGASSGLGAETVRALATHGAHVIGIVRNIERARATLGDACELAECDLSSLSSVRDCAERLARQAGEIEVIIANAGVMAVPDRRETADGFELQFATNYLGHFVLINRLAPSIRPGGRVVLLSSAGHRYSDVDLEDPNFLKTPYTPFGAYGRSKTATILFAVEFDQRHQHRGIRATAIHPGGVQTELSRHLGPGEMDALIDDINATQPPGSPQFQYKSIPQGAATSVWAAFVADADEIGGRYCEDCHVSGLSVGPMVREGVQPYALDRERARALWSLSERMTGEKY